MKFKFKIQQYQTEAVENTVAVFTGQPSYAIEDIASTADGRHNDSWISMMKQDTGTTAWNWMGKPC